MNFVQKAKEWSSFLFSDISVNHRLTCHPRISAAAQTLEHSIRAPTMLYRTESGLQFKLAKLRPPTVLEGKANLQV